MRIFKTRERSYADKFFYYLKPIGDFYDQDLLRRFKELDNEVEESSKTLKIAIKQEIVDMERVLRQRELTKAYQKK